MSSAIGSIGNNYQMSMQAGGMGGARGMKRPDSTQMADEIFSKLDTANQGYLQASDFGSDNEDVFAALDTDSDGKVTKSELSTRLKELSDQLDSQFNAMRTQGMQGMQGQAGMPPPPPPGGGNDAGMDKEQLTAMASSASQSGNTQAASDLASLVENFDAADSNQDGKVTFAESMAYKESQSAKTGGSSASSSSSPDQTVADNEQQSRIMMRLMEMMRSYGQPDEAQRSSTLNLTA